MKIGRFWLYTEYRHIEPELYSNPIIKRGTFGDFGAFNI